MGGHREKAPTGEAKEELMPMVGRPIVVNGEVIGIACSRESVKRCKCGRRADLLCDYALRGKKAGKTCDVPLCARCTTRVGHDKDYCPAHAELDKNSKKEKGEAARTPDAVDGDRTRGVVSPSIDGSGR